MEENLLMTVRQLEPVLNKNINLASYYKICNKKQQQQQILIIDIGVKIPFHSWTHFSILLV